MVPSEAEMREMGHRLLLARMRLLSEHGFYGLLLMHMRFAIGDEFDTAWVSSDTITFNPDFMGKLSESELEFVLEHEVLHAALGHLSRGLSIEDQELFNIACDIVVNSNILRSNDMDPCSITLAEFGESMHLTPDGREGYDFTAEEVYEMLLNRLSANGYHGVSQPRLPGILSGSSPEVGDGLEEVRSRGRGDGWDRHVPSGGDSDDEARIEWIQWMRDAREAMRARDSDNKYGLVPLGVERLLGELDSPRVDWRLLLNDFIQEEVCDWSFSIPDRRLSDSPFLMPSYSDTETAVRGVLFMVDTSESVSDKELTSLFGEIRGAIEQYGGKMDGWVGFFDSEGYEPVRFDSVEDLASIRPRGGGGTRFEAVFEAIGRYLPDENVSCVVILTDGWAPFPDERVSGGIPVLWCLCQSSAEIKPPWGRVARID